MFKKIVATIALLSAMMTMSAKPIFVGHRGSLYGLENSVESFTEGAKLGYQYLETDFKVTKDLQFVCTHDDNTTRLGGTKTIASSTLDELQSETLSQTRSGVAYTGRLCSAKEYLAVCREYNVRPLIELKWATGVNSNDCSNIPLLIKLLDDEGFRDKCIILTSMKPCLEYIRKNYPDITLQFLTGEYWSNHFDWCVEQGIDVDIQAGYFDKNTVEKFREAGLKVNVWTVNNDADYVKYGNWGCEFITTDYLDPKTVSELDPTASVIPNRIDYPTNDLTVRGNYTPEVIFDGAVPEAIADESIVSVAYHNGTWSVLTKKDNVLSVYDFRADGSGLHRRALPADIDLFALAYTADGYLCAIPMVNLPFAEGGAVMNIYTWDDADAQPRVLTAINASKQLGASSELSSLGSEFLLSGRRADLKVYMKGYISDLSLDLNLCAIHIKNEKIVSAMTVPYNNFGINQTAMFYTLVSPTSRDYLYISNDGNGRHGEYVCDWDASSISNYAKSAAQNLGIIGTFFRRGAKVYLATLDMRGTLRFNDYTPGSPDKMTEVASIASGISDRAVFSAYVGSEISDDGAVVHLLELNGRKMVTVLMHRDNKVEPAPDAVFAAERVWQRSVATTDAPDTNIIDGTNAQQGTAVADVFFINNCSEQKLYSYSTNDVVREVAGGAGFGCCRDDYGNIIVRNDKATGNEHSFVIYAREDALAGNGTPASTITATVEVAGQTNFISASGNVLGTGGGHIYLYPNKANSVNIIRVVEGAVTSTAVKTDLAMTGTTAGYVFPIDDNTENWLYNIRGTGIYRYSGGDNIAVSISRAGTTAPSRNSTCGCAYFVFRGHEFLVHNSGKNYLGGLTIRNLTTDKVIASFDPLGDKGYATGGNYSTANWIIPEAGENPYTMYIYQYCPANGIAKIKLSDTNDGVAEVIADTAAERLSVVVEDGILSAGGVDTFTVYDLAGIARAHAAAGTADISALPRGVYIVAAADGRTAKIVR